MEGTLVDDERLARPLSDGADPSDGSEETGQRVQRIDADVDERPDPLLEVRGGVGGEAFPRRNTPEDGARRRDRIAHVPETELFPDDLDLWVHQDAGSGRQDDMPFACARSERSTGVGGHGERLLAVDMLAPVDRRSVDLVVQLRRSEVENGVDVLIAQQRRVSHVCGDAEPFRHLSDALLAGAGDRDHDRVRLEP